MTKIPVKYGLELTIFVNAIFLFSFYEACTNPNTTGIIILVFTFLLVNYLIFSIRYSVDQHNLYIKYGIFATTTIELKDIKEVKKTKNLISSPAPSVFGRVKIISTFQDVIISPLYYEEFKALLKQKNPNIEFKD